LLTLLQQHARSSAVVGGQRLEFVYGVLLGFVWTLKPGDFAITNASNKLSAVEDKVAVKVGIAGLALLVHVSLVKSEFGTGSS
jgi:hypothetical protein